MEYQELKTGIKDHLNSAAEDFFMVGYFLRQISENALFMEDGYENIWEFAKGEYGLSTSSASRFMAINARFSVDGGEHMAEKYIGMGVSKLQEMLGLPDEELEKVTKETTVREIRALKKKREEPKSFFGLPKTEKEKHPYTYTPGCGDGGHACFSCTRICEIRQEERYCVTATMGNPFPCTQMNKEKRLDMEAGLFSGECQHLHPELASVRKGDQEPEPCCLDCEYKTCFSRCDVAKKRDEAERKKIQEEERQRQKEAKAKKPEMTDMEIRGLYEWLGIQPEEEFTGNDLREKYGKHYHGGFHKNTVYNCTPRGVRTGRSREMTWGEIAKRFKGIQESEIRKDDFIKRSNGAQKNVRNLIKQQEEKRKKEAEAKKAEKKTRSQEPEAGREPEIIDADFKEVENEPFQEAEETLCDICGHDGECVSRKTQDDGCIGYEEKAQDLEIAENPESYTLADVREQLRKCEADLKAYREVGGMPDFTLRKQKILVDALQLLAEKKEFDEMEEAGYLEGGGRVDWDIRKIVCTPHT